MAERDTQPGAEDAAQSERLLTDRLGADWNAALDRVLGAQTELYGQLDGLCEQQRGLVEAGDIDRLAGLLAERSKVIERLSAAAESFTPFAELWAHVEQAADEAALRDARRRIDAISAMASSIARRDAEDGAEIRTRRDELADKLAGNTKSRAATNAYAGPRPSGPRFQDREG